MRSSSEVLARAGSIACAELVGLALEEVHLAEQVHFLLAVQERDFVKAGQVGGQTFGCLGTAWRLAAGGRGHRGHDLGLGRRVVEAGIGDELELGLEHPPGPDLVDQPIDARSRAAKLGGQYIDRDAHAIAEINLALGLLVQGRRGGREDCPVRVLAVVGLQGQSNGFRGTCHLTCDPPRHFDQAHLPRSIKRHATGAADDLVPFRVGQLPKS